MTKTKTDIFGILIILMSSISSVGLLLWVGYEWFISEEKIGLFQRILLTIITSILTPYLLTVELPKLKTVEIEDKKITLRSILTGKRREILITEFDGFKTMSQWARGGPVYEIILLVKGRPIHDISSNYIKNYNEIRTELGRRLTNLGTEKFSYLKYLKERLT